MPADIISGRRRHAPHLQTVKRRLSALLFLQQSQTQPLRRPLLLFSSTVISRHQRSCCSAVSSGEATKPQPVGLEKSVKTHEFRKKLKIVDVKFGADD